MNLFNVSNYKLLSLAFSLFFWILTYGNLQGQTNCSTVDVTETLNLSAAPTNLQVIRTYEKISEIFFSLPDGKSIADYSSYDNMFMEPVKKKERFVYAKDSSGVNIVLKHVLDPQLQFKPSVEPYELMVMYPTRFDIFNRFGNKIYSTERDTSNLNESGGSGGEGGSGGGWGSEFDSNSISIQYIEGDSIYNIVGPGFVSYVNKPKAIMINTELDSLDDWISKEFIFYDPGEENRQRPVLEVYISRDTLPISGDCVFRVYSLAYLEYCSILIDSSSSLREIAVPLEQDPHFTLTTWPNPVSNLLNMTVESNSDNEKIEIEIFNLEGRLMFFGNTYTNLTQLIDVSNYPAGMYLIRVITSEGLIVDRIVVQN